MTFSGLCLLQILFYIDSRFHKRPKQHGTNEQLVAVWKVAVNTPCSSFGRSEMEVVAVRIQKVGVWVRCKVVSVLCVHLFFYKHMPKTSSSWKPGFEKNLNFYYTTFLPAKYVHFLMEETNIQIFNMFQWQPKKTINGNHLCWGMEALQETVGFALTTDLFRPTPRNGPLPNVMNFEGI